MAWTWRFEKADGTEVPPSVEPEEFTTQGDAESWVGEVWKELLAGGVEQVELYEGEQKVYGPMSLRAEETAAAAAPAADTSDAAETSDTSETPDAPEAADSAEAADPEPARDPGIAPAPNDGL